MMQVKLIRGKEDQIEELINRFLLQLGRVAGMITEIREVQLLHVGGPGQNETFMILYNQYPAPVPTAAVDINNPKKPTGPKGPGHLPHP